MPTPGSRRGSGGGGGTLDATPPQADSSPFRTRTGILGLYADWLRHRWDKYVVNYSMRMQADAVKGGVRTVRRAGEAFRFQGWEGIGGGGGGGAGGLFLFATGFFLFFP